MIRRNLDEYIERHYAGIINKIDKIPWWGVFIMGLLWRLIVNVVVRSCFHDDLYDISTEYDSILLLIIRAVFVAPIIETLIYQYGIIEISFAVNNSNKLADVVKSALISATVFGAGHFYSFEYMLIAFFMGLFLAFVYLHYRRLYKTKSAGFWMTVSFHALSNSISAIMQFC